MSEAPNHLGVVSLQRGEATLSIRFDYAAIHALQVEFGIPEWITYVSQGVDKLEVKPLAHLLSLTSGITSEQSKELIFPLTETRDAIRKAWVLAWDGGVKADDEASEAPEKMTPQGILWGQLSKLLSAPGSHTQNSGH
jgi:hypothetical protein